MRAHKPTTMTPFITLGLGDFISERGLEITIKAFSHFYHNITPKHQRRVELKLIDKAVNKSRIQTLTKHYNIDHLTQFLDLEEQELIETQYKIASLIMLPININVSNIVQESLSYSLPIICFKNTTSEGLLDQTCSMQLEYDSDEVSVIEFSRILKLLYFDPEARKILKRGALQKYEAKFTWGNKNRIRVGS